jgi:hypothetical protein
MKGLCYIVLIIAFFIYYQQNPVFTIVIIIIGLGVYIYFKSRKSDSSSGIFAFFSRHSPSTQKSKLEDFMTLMLLQQTLQSSSPPSIKEDPPEKMTKYEEQIETVKNEMLALLEEK